MGQYTILLNNSTKQLVATNKIALCQHESLVDKLTFIVPFQYTEDIDLRNYVCTLYWKNDSVNVAHVDVLEQEEEVYKDAYQRYFLPINSPINRYAGDIEMYLVFTHNDYETKKRYKMETFPISITIDTIKDYYEIIPNESFNAIDDRMDELQSKIDMLTTAADIYDKTKADSLTLDQTTNELQLTSHGDKIGEPVVLDLIDESDKKLDELDQNSNDGVIDLDDINWETINV